jgi:alpha-methylacyl-CoA racemase
VLNMVEATRHPHAVARQAFAEVAGVVQPAAAPRFSLTPAGPLRPPPQYGADTETVLAACGFSDDEIQTLRGQQAIE